MNLEWMKNEKGEWEASGADPKGSVFCIETMLATGFWVKSISQWGLNQAKKIVADAIAKKQTGVWHGYRIVPMSAKALKKTKSSGEEVPEVAGKVRHVPVEFLKQNPPKLEDKKQEEVEMPKKAKEKKEAKANGGYLGFRPNSAIHDFATALKDGKPHKLSVIFAQVKKDWKMNPEWKLHQLKRVSDERGYTITVDRKADTVQLTMGKVVVEKKKATKPVVKAEAKKKTNGNADTEEESSVTKLLRKALKTGKGFTKNKLVEKIHTDHSIPPKQIDAALLAEINKGGITEDKGQLSLA